MVKRKITAFSKIEFVELLVVTITMWIYVVEGSQYHKLSKQPMVVTMLDLKSQFLCMCLLLNYPYHEKGSFKNKFTSLQELYLCRAFRLH